PRPPDHNAETPVRPADRHPFATADRGSAHTPTPPLCDPASDTPDRGPGTRPTPAGHLRHRRRPAEPQQPVPPASATVPRAGTTDPCCQTAAAFARSRQDTACECFRTPLRWRPVAA